MIDGIKWIFKSATQLAERFGLNERTVRRHLNEQVKQGLWNREKKEAKWGKQVYWYSIGEVDLLSGPVRSDQAKSPHQPDKMSASKTRTSTFRKTLPGPASGTTEQPSLEERRTWLEPLSAEQLEINKKGIAELRASRQQPTALTGKNSQRPLQAPVRALASPLGSLTSSSPSSAYTASPGSSPVLSVSPRPSQGSPQYPLRPSTHSNPSTPAN